MQSRNGLKKWHKSQSLRVAKRLKFVLSSWVELWVILKVWHLLRLSDNFSFG